MVAPSSLEGLSLQKHEEAQQYVQGHTAINGKVKFNPVALLNKLVILLPNNGPPAGQPPLQMEPRAIPTSRE